MTKEKALNAIARMRKQILMISSSLRYIELESGVLLKGEKAIVFLKKWIEEVEGIRN